MGRKRNVRPLNPNHHIWNNNGTWWVHYTVYPCPLTKERVRNSLRTKSLTEARQRRDALLGRVGREGEGGESAPLPLAA